MKLIEKIKTVLGIILFLFACYLNASHALNGYGILDPENELHSQVLAQTNTAGGECGCGGVSCINDGSSSHCGDGENWFGYKSCVGKPEDSYDMRNMPVCNDTYGMRSKIGNTYYSIGCSDALNRYPATLDTQCRR